MKKLYIFCLLLCSGYIFAQTGGTAKLTLEFINNIDKEVSIQQMPNPGSNLKHESLMAKIDPKTHQASFEFELNQPTDFYWVSSVNELGGQITLSPGDDLHMSIDREKGYNSKVYEGKGAEWNNFYQAIIMEQRAESSEIFALAEAGEVPFSEIIEKKVDRLDRTLKNIDAKMLQMEGKSNSQRIEVLKLDFMYEVYTELLVYLRWFKPELTEADHTFFNQIDVSNDQAALLSRKYLDFISSYFFHQYTKKPPQEDVSQEEFAETLFSGPTLAIWQADRIITRIQRGFASLEDMENAKKEFSRPEIQRDLEQAYLLFQRSQLSEYDPNTHFITGEFDSVKDILKLFEGKVIYIDFWGSWCGPCIGNIPRNLRIQKEFADKDVVFLFLAGRDQEKFWKRAIKKNQISGHHWLMDDAMLEEANELFEIHGFPAHALVDSTGRIVDKNPGKRPTKELFAKIEALLK